MIAWIALGWHGLVLVLAFATAQRRIPQSGQTIYLVLSLLLVNEISRALTWKDDIDSNKDGIATPWIVSRVAACYLLGLRFDSWMILMQRAWTTSSAVKPTFLCTTRWIYRTWQGYLLVCAALLTAISIVLWDQDVLSWTETILILTSVDAGLCLLSIILLTCTQYIVFLLSDEFKEVASFTTIRQFQTFLLCGTIGAGLASAVVASTLLTVDTGFQHLDQVAVLFWPLVPVAQVISLSFFYISHITYMMQQRESGARRNSVTLISLNLPSHAV